MKAAPHLICAGAVVLSTVDFKKIICVILPVDKWRPTIFEDAQSAFFAFSYCMASLTSDHHEFFQGVSDIWFDNAFGLLFGCVRTFHGPTLRSLDLNTFVNGKFPFLTEMNYDFYST